MFVKYESGPPYVVVSIGLTSAQSLAGRPGSPLVVFGFSQIPSPSKAMIGSVADDSEIWLSDVEESLTIPINVSSSPSYVPGVGSLDSVAFGSSRIEVPPFWT